MLKEIEELNKDTRVVVVYVKSPILQTVIKDKLKERLDIGRQTTLEAKTATGVREIKRDSVVSPFYGGQWLLEIDTSNISLSDILKELGNINSTSVNVYWTDDYRLYKKIVESDKAEGLNYYFKDYYFGRLEPSDIHEIENHLVTDEKYKLNQEMIGYLEANYTYDIDKVCNLFLSTRTGTEIKETKDIIELVGLGGNTVDNFVMKILTSNPKTVKGTQQTLKRLLEILEDLTIEEDVNTIRNFMKYTVDTIFEIKELQILGLYTRERKDIPPEYREKKIKMMRRFERAILEQINMARIVNLQMAFAKYNTYNAHEDIVRIIMYYIEGIQELNELNPESTEMSASFVRRRR